MSLTFIEASTETMNVEYNRLASFNFWPSQIVSANPDANPLTLAKYGFYYQPKNDNPGYHAKGTSVQDRVVNYCCKVAISDVLVLIFSSLSLDGHLWDTLEMNSQILDLIVLSW